MPKHDSPGWLATGPLTGPPAAMAADGTTRIAAAAIGRTNFLMDWSLLIGASGRRRLAPAGDRTRVGARPSGAPKRQARFSALASSYSARRWRSHVGSRTYERERRAEPGA